MIIGRWSELNDSSVHHSVEWRTDELAIEMSGDDWALVATLVWKGSFNTPKLVVSISAANSFPLWSAEMDEDDVGDDYGVLHHQ